MKYQNFLLNKMSEIHPYNDEGDIETIPFDIYLLKKGRKIFIKPENRGKFNETKKRTGKTTEELLHSPDPLTRKRAQFAMNARK
jgi:hypothetical protein